MPNKGTRPVTARLVNAGEGLVRLTTEKLDQDASMAGLDLTAIQVMLTLRTHGPLKQPEIAELVEATEHKARTTLKSLQTLGLACQHEPGQEWALSDTGHTFISRALQPALPKPQEFAQRMSDTEVRRSTMAISRAINTLSNQS